MRFETDKYGVWSVFFIFFPLSSFIYLLIHLFPKDDMRRREEMAAIEKIVEGDGVITVYFNLSISQSYNILRAGLLQLPLRGGGGQC